MVCNQVRIQGYQILQQLYNVSIQYGNDVASLYPYVLYGNIVCNIKLDVNTGFKFGQLALELVSKLNAKAIKSDIFGTAACFILHRKSHVRETLPLIQQNYTVGLEFGSLEFVGYGAQLFCLSSFLCGETLNNLEQETRAYCKSLQKLNQLTTANYYCIAN